jgi:hypothetical protein
MKTLAVDGATLIDKLALLDAARVALSGLEAQAPPKGAPWADHKAHDDRFDVAGAAHCAAEDAVILAMAGHRALLVRGCLLVAWPAPHPYSGDRVAALPMPITVEEE